jgi:hypothetical protein
MITLAYAPADAKLGGQLKGDLERVGYALSEKVGRGKDALLIALISEQGNRDSNVQAKIEQALDQHIHIIPVMASTAPLPALINNLPPMDFTEGSYPFEALQAAIDALTSPDAPRPLTALTPSKRRSNRQTGLILMIPVLVMFVAGLYLVGVMGVQYPQSEYDIQETARVQQRNTLIGPTLEVVLPRTTADALAFDTTVQALPTRLREYAAATATSYIAGTKTPEPTWTYTPTFAR